MDHLYVMTQSSGGGGGGGGGQGECFQKINT